MAVLHERTGEGGRVLWAGKKTYPLAALRVPRDAGRTEKLTMLQGPSDKAYHAGWGLRSMAGHPRVEVYTASGPRAGHVLNSWANEMGVEL